MPRHDFFEFVKILLPTGVAAAFGWLLLRRLEEVKSEVARYSDFSRKWAELFFDASNAFMVSVERLITLYTFLSNVANPNDEVGMERQHKANALLPELHENYLRIQRLVPLAPLNGPVAVRAATQVYESVGNLTKTRMGNVVDVRREIDAFNQAVRISHAEMLAARSVK
jgi:hypothetical protein